MLRDLAKDDSYNHSNEQQKTQDDTKKRCHKSAQQQKTTDYVVISSCGNLDFVLISDLRRFHAKVTHEIR